MTILRRSFSAEFWFWLYRFPFIYGGGGNVYIKAQESTFDEMDDEAYNLLYMMSASDTSFAAICNMAGSYLQSNPEAGRFAKRYARWRNFWSNRVGVDGNIWEAKQAMQEWANEPVCTENGDWQPLTAQLCPNKQARGIVVSVYAPPCSTPSCTPQVIYAGTNCSGLWKTSDAGNTWNCITDNIRMPGLGVSSILVLDDDPSCSEEILIASGLTSQVDSHYGIGILKTCDGGNSWEEILGWPSWYGQVSVKLMKDPTDPNTIWCLGTESLWKSSDRGQTWIFIQNLPDVVPDGLHFSDMEFLSDDPDIIILSTKDRGDAGDAKLYRIDNIDPITQIAIWTIITPNPTSSKQQILLETSENNIITMYQAGGITLTMSRSSDSGDSWIDNNPTGLVSQGINNALVTFKVHPYDDQLMYFGKVNFYRSTNGGQNFSALISGVVNGTGTNSWHCDVRGLQIYNPETTPVANEVQLLMGNDGGVSFSTNGGTVFQNMNGEYNPNGSSLNITQYYDIANSSLRPGLVAGGTQDNSFFKYDNGQLICLVSGNCSTASPPSVGIGGDGGQTIISWANPMVIFSRFNESLGKSINGGSSFTSWIVPDPGIADMEFLDPKMLQDPLDPDIVYYAKGRNFYKLQTNPFPTQPPPLPATYTFTSSDFTSINALGVSPSDPNNIFVAAAWGGTSKKLFKSTNNGTAFTDVATMSGSNIGTVTEWFSITDIIFHPDDPEKVWISLGGFDGSRVAYSSNGGINWSGFGTGLPQLPVNKLVYHVGSNDVIYAATDVGVYRYNPDTQIWECYNNGLPVCVVMGIEIDYCKQLLHIGTFGRGIWESPLAPLTENWQITQNTTWEANTVTNSSTDIEIMPGATLTLKGKLNLAQDKRIIVQRGAKLVIEGDNNPNGNNGLLTNGCGDRHGGVDVWGNTSIDHETLFGLADPNTLIPADYINLPINTNDPGMVILYNGAKIENGRTAISTQRRGGYFPDYYGGIVYAHSAFFTNNRKATEFMQYKPFNYSRFKNCQITANTSHNIAFEGITVWDCTGIVIDHCTFENNNPAIYNNCTAITTHDAERLQIINDCQFNNVIKGIILQATNEGLGDAIITDNVFTNCRLGIQNFQTREMIARGNTFSVTAINAQHITLSGNCGYRISENTFVNGTAAVAAFFTSLLTPGNNLIECNTFQNCGTGVYANSNNIGLRFQNNDFTTQNADVQLDNFGILPNQGTWDPVENSFLPYFNFFTLTNPTTRITTTGTTSPFFYYYHTDPNIFTSDANDRLVPHCFTVETPPFPGCGATYNYFGIETAVPSEFLYSGCLDLDGDGNPGMLPPDEDCKTRECYEELKLLIAGLENQKDGGNKEELLNDLFNSPEALETYQKYLDASPYLTDEVLTEAAENALLSSIRKANILLANAPLSNDMMNTAYQHVSTTVYQMLYALKYYLVISDRDQLDMRIGTEVRKKETLFNELYTRYFDHPDSLHAFLIAENSTYAKHCLFGSLMRHGDMAEAQTLLNGIPDGTPAEQDYKTVQQINLQFQSATEPFSLSETQYETLRAIADCYQTQSPAAQVLLNLLEGEQYEWQIPENASDGKSATPPYPKASLTELKSANRLWIHPNPAKEQVTVNIPFYLFETNAFLQVFDTGGKLLQNIEFDQGQTSIILNTEKWANGLYILSLQSGDARLAQAKLSVLH
ncbi:MAG: T9SS type A sorting domain-containing protein [Sphingobacteriales bacterium]|nr:MAG: T9SS type A sorting domain-containing protein [Sphingobacteriales bacterium]